MTVQENWPCRVITDSSPEITDVSVALTGDRMGPKPGQEYKTQRRLFHESAGKM